MAATYETKEHNTAETMPKQPLKLAVLGATGPSGKVFVAQALEQGHHVKALVRNPAKLEDVKHPNLTVIQCTSVTKRENLETHFNGCDAVVSCLGVPVPLFQLPFGTKVTFLQDSARAIIPAMRVAKVNRFVAMSSWFLDTTARDIPAYLKWYIFPFKLGKLLDDHYEMDKYMDRECPDIDYTLVRLPALTDDPMSEKPIKVMDHGAFYIPDTTCISRPDAVRFMLSCLGTDKWHKKCPAIATQTL